MYAARIAAASGDASGADAGFDANPQKRPSTAALTASNIASCTIAVRISVLLSFSPTATPNDEKAVAQSSSTVDAGRLLTVLTGAWPLTFAFDRFAGANRMATTANTTKVQSFSFMIFPFFERL
jgi:hypothetical protein